MNVTSQRTSDSEKRMGKMNNLTHLEASRKGTQQLTLSLRVSEALLERLKGAQALHTSPHGNSLACPMRYHARDWSLTGNSLWSSVVADTATGESFECCGIGVGL
jgi:hypothetical protein